MASGFRFFLTLPEVAEAFLCSPTTVKRWVRSGLLVPRYQILSGRCYRLVFEPAELIRFMDEFFPRPGDLDPNHRPRSHKGRVEMIRRLRSWHQLYIGRVNAMRTAKECGLEGREPEAQEKEPVIVNQRPSGGPRSRRGSKVQAEGEREDERSLWSSRDDEES